MTKVVAMLRVKDAILFIEKWLKRISTLADEIVVVDNGSADGTLQILQNYPKVMALEQTSGFNEGRDKVLAYELARSRHADWVLWLDVDEIFEDRMNRNLLDKMINSACVTHYKFRLFNFHKDYQHFEARCDKLWYICSPRTKLWKEQPNTYFSAEYIHNGDIMGLKGQGQISPIRIKHIGSIDVGYLKRKTDIYLAVDPANKDMYIRHRDQDVYVWKWYEYNERPILVNFQLAFLWALYFIKIIIYYSTYYPKRIIKLLINKT